MIFFEDCFPFFQSQHDNFIPRESEQPLFIDDLDGIYNPDHHSRLVNCGHITKVLPNTEIQAEVDAGPGPNTLGVESVLTNRGSDLAKSTVGSD